MDASRTLPRYELTDELARYCLPPANRDPNRTLAWVNSICVLFLLIGVLGAKLGAISSKPPPPLPEQAIPAIVEPPPPTTLEAKQNEERPDQSKPEVPQVVIVTPESTAITF